MMKKVLIIDDDELVRSAIARMLQMLSWDPDTTSSGEEALGKIEDTLYDVIITDYEMPGMKGPELIENIRSKSPASVVVLMSGSASDKIIQDSGADMYLPKPFSIGALKETLGRTTSNGQRQSSAL